ncbi:crossover junction endodeoxyribonuclease RuvC [Desulfoplanes formicivorans]|uniref:Crossover junction endodeoxyribonuclease RuvC n=1 Tax=Desulfoplanes formicivorans TaxID=1592317 RepID=A0A194ADM3_9BACT|nr:crossover junction endodeoxyribonuclease RuvC [Desulfoplanes formicivorans]GAU07443.1 Holliday junction resolvase [Desulfoplanes formicivorans]
MAGEEMVVLGIDPGSRCCGYGVVREVSGQLSLVATGTIRPPLDKPLSTRLGHIFAAIVRLIELHEPDVASVEDAFFARNAASALKLGQARGAALTACAYRDVPVHSYEPTLVKKTIVGSGRADKSQVAFMVARLLGCKGNWAKDASDALAIAICHLNHRRLQRLYTTPD